MITANIHTAPGTIAESHHRGNATWVAIDTLDGSRAAIFFRDRATVDALIAALEIARNYVVPRHEESLV